MISAVGEERTASLISKSGYIVAFGSNDIANTYFTTPLRSPHYDIPAYTDLMLESAVNFVQVQVEQLQTLALHDQQLFRVLALKYHTSTILFIR